jgi:ABC-2 type transport system permease protein
MKRILLIALEEYRRNVLRKRFIFALLSPLFIIAIVSVISFISISAIRDSQTSVIGYIDPQNFLARATQQDDETSFKPYANEVDAKQDLLDKKISAYYLLAPDFAQTGKVDVVYWNQEPTRDAQRAFRTFVKSALTSELAPQISKIILDGAAFTFETPDKTRTFDRDNILWFVLPIVVGVAFIIALLMGSQYLLQAVVDEKENRTIEILVSSVTPVQLMSGKIVGLASVALTQIVVWGAGVVVAFLAIRSRLPFLQNITIEPSFLFVIVILFVLQYLMYSAIMAAIGGNVIDAKQAQSISVPFVLLAISPEFFLPALFIDPNGIIAVVLTLIPFTSPFTIAFRYSMTSIPIWQPIAAIALLAIAALASLWIASKIFRVGLLRFGQKVPLTELFDSLRV